VKILAFVPARGGSKELPRKNMLNLSGKPLIDYTLDVLKGLGDRIHPFVSTDDDEISEFCKKQGFDMSYQRPSKLAGDSSSIIDAVWDAVQWVEREKKYVPDAILILQPTSPFRRIGEIKKAIERFQEKNLKSLASVTNVKQHPYECVELNERNWNYLVEPPPNITRRQDYQMNYYFIDGSIYLATIKFLLKYQQFVVKDITDLFILENNPSIDIDNILDFKFAETVLDSKNIFIF
jgi:N-acylneuraminate cytidylyltransferase/CMP-N,N'-diacetyllegionaminic acid synthase